ncbi:MAG: 2-hydroxyacyl-CoA dehydratase [Planctomycetes bacterium]|nr:2-hydroxyacyl-CoA dehydratase [Planctomycetota bacterium]
MSSEVQEMSKKLMQDYYQQLQDAKSGGKPTACIMISGNCVEILRAFDIQPIFPEVNALQTAIRKQSLPLILAAEQRGYSSDNCAYVKADMGMYFTKTGNLPDPSFVVCNYVGCNVYVKWFEHVADYFHKPLIMIDIPFLREKVPSEEDVKYVIRQLESLIKHCEDLTGTKFDIDKLREILKYSRISEDGWSQAKDLCKKKPAPFDAYFDAINMMGPINVLRGTKEAAEFFMKSVLVYEQLVKEKKGPLPEEKFRIVIEGPPPYPYYRSFRELFSKWGAVACQSTYSTVGGIWEFGFRHDPKKPLESIARQMIIENLCNRSLLSRYNQIESYVKNWSADALVIHSVKSCRLFSAGQGDMRDYFVHSLDTPTLMIESDLEDPRYYSHAQLKNRIDAFFESLQHKRLTANLRT